MGNEMPCSTEADIYSVFQWIAIVLAILLIVQPSIEIIINEINQLLTKSNVSAFKTKAIIRDNTRSTIGKKVY